MRLAVSMRPSIRLFPLYILNQLTFDLDFFCICMGHNHSSPEVESQGRRSGSKINAVCYMDVYHGVI